MITITASWATLIEIRMSGDGFNGTVGFGWDAEFQSSMRYRFGGGAPFVVMLGLLKPAAVLTTYPVGHGNARPCCSGPIIRLYR
jgi:hypothetical protein